MAETLVYDQLHYIEDVEHEVLWIKLKPNKLSRKYSFIIIACIYHPPGVDNGSLWVYLITNLDTVLRRIPDCGVVFIGDFNQINNLFLRTYYGYNEFSKRATRNRALLYKMWYNVSRVYGCPIVFDGVTSYRKMVLLVPSCFTTLDTSIVQSIFTRRIGNSERSMFT